MAISNRFEAFSITRCQVLDGASTFLAALAALTVDDDVYGVNSGSLTPQTSSYSNEGNDKVLSTWDWMDLAELAVQSGYLSLPLYAAMSGGTIVATEDIGPPVKQTKQIDLWHEDEIVTPPRPVILTMAAKDEDGVAANFHIGLYKVSFAPLGLEGISYKSGMKVNLNGKALFSAKDEVGAAHADAKSKVGTLLLIER